MMSIRRHGHHVPTTGFAQDTTEVAQSSPTINVQYLLKTASIESDTRDTIVIDDLSASYGGNCNASTATVTFTLWGKIVGKHSSTVQLSGDIIASGSGAVTMCGASPTRTKDQWVNSTNNYLGLPYTIPPNSGTHTIEYYLSWDFTGSLPGVTSICIGDTDEAFTTLAKTLHGGG